MMIAGPQKNHTPNLALEFRVHNAEQDKERPEPLDVHPSFGEKEIEK
jgi:hypothetical protein